MFVFCAALVGLGYFVKVYLSFLLVGHTHEDIDQRFSVISSTLKRHDIDSMQELMKLIQKGASHIEAFTSTRHLQYVWDWKKFSTPYLYRGLNTFVGISTKHHFKFYLKEKKPFVQTKDYARDPLWEPVEGYQCLTEVPSRDQKLSFADVYEANDQEMKALEEFIKMKERCIMKLMYVKRNLRAIDDTKWLIQYLKQFSKTNKSAMWEQLHFWPPVLNSSNMASMQQSDSNAQDPEHCPSIVESVQTESTVLNHLPSILPRGYFGPRRGKPQTTASRPAKKPRPSTTEASIATEWDLEDVFPEFDPFTDVQVGHMVAMNTSNEDRESSIPFFLGKVALQKNVSSTSGSMKIIWYWPKPTSQQDDYGMWTYRYKNYMKQKWIPSNEPSNWVDLETTITSWRLPLRTKTSAIEKAIAPKEISIPKAMTFHLLQHMANQSKAIDDEHLKSDRHVPERNALE